MENIIQATEYPRSFLMVASNDHITGKTGLTVLVEISKNNGPFVTAEGTVIEVGFGWYQIILTAIDTGTLGSLKYHCTAVDADPTDFEDLVITESEAQTETFTTQTLKYATVSEANAYFAGRLEHSIWDVMDESKKLKVLAMSTEIINQLNYAGVKADPDQLLEFPRGSDTTIPLNIKKACCLIAYALADQKDPEIEIDLIGQSQSSFGDVRTRYDRSFIPEATAHGIPSHEAWRLLKPFLRSPTQLILSRVS